MLGINLFKSCSEYVHDEQLLCEKNNSLLISIKKKVTQVKEDLKTMFNLQDEQELYSQRWFEESGKKNKEQR